MAMFYHAEGVAAATASPCRRTALTLNCPTWNRKMNPASYPLATPRTGSATVTARVMTVGKR